MRSIINCGVTLAGTHMVNILRRHIDRSNPTVLRKLCAHSTGHLVLTVSKQGYCSTNINNYIVACWFWRDTLLFFNPCFLKDLSIFVNALQKSYCYVSYYSIQFRFPPKSHCPLILWTQYFGFINLKEDQPRKQFPRRMLTLRAVQLEPIKHN